MQNNQKRDLILDAMQKLMNNTNAQSISVSEIAKVAGIGKGSIYYYFKSKEEILEAVIERSYSFAIEKAKSLVDTVGLSALKKMDSQLNEQSKEQIQKTLDVFSYMLETSFGIEKGGLDYIWEGVKKAK